ncbi:LAO/AO transport system ATPase [Longilinea arvoryzae]|uniref:LAO/AO transport system ATPase n=1 Tax=Longilinea arvoryzae TaxID=360412 RepID=A0A0S7BCW6_9CHLR|nr:methylmalonyl Co-A mutase-associated GTPase MeaB [Longilinea arvoryzae]GAP15623.1 LAO/AO transport system ATPase [Longilinea arvoryzae]
MNLVEGVLAGERLALARLITQVENGSPEGRDALNRLFSYTGRAHLIGVTGSPGTGKSSLVNQLARAYRHPMDGRQPVKVAVVAIDPSSPFTGGALLGDRVRMRDLAGDPGVFVRSMASRGALGGLSRSTAAVVQVLDAAGFDKIFIETVGAGQSEVDIARLAHTTLVVEAPGLGDDIQAIKAGILEIADILIVNKADRPGVENTERALRSMLELAHPEQMQMGSCGRGGHGNKPRTGTLPALEDQIWIPPVLRTVAMQGSGTQEVLAAIERHAAHLRETGEWQARERERLESDLNNLLQAILVARWREGVSDAELQDIVSRLQDRDLSPYQAAEQLLDLAESPNKV